MTLRSGFALAWPMPSLMVACLMAASLVADSAAAHTAGSTGYAEVTVDGGTVSYGLSLTVDALAGAAGPAFDVDGLAGLVAAKVTVAADGRACAAVPTASAPPVPERATVRVVVLYACAAPPGELAITDDMSDVLGPAHHTLAQIEWRGGREQRVFEADSRTVTLLLGEPAAAPEVDGLVASLVPGAAHVLLGLDHMLLTVALLLWAGQLPAMLAAVTAFTAGQSLTLAASMLGLVALPVPIVEAVMALAVACAAAGGLVLRDRSWRWSSAAGALAGLVHGLGIGVHDGRGAGGNGFAELLGFGLGTEAGQVLLVVALLPVLLWFRRFDWRDRLTRAASAAIAVAGILLLVVRAHSGDI